MRINIDAFKNVHGKSPRGKGCWVFAESLNVKKGDLFCPHYMSFSRARKLAKTRFNNNEVAEIFVLP